MPGQSTVTPGVGPGAVTAPGGRGHLAEAPKAHIPVPRCQIGEQGLWGESLSRRPLHLIKCCPHSRNPDEWSFLLCTACPAPAQCAAPHPPDTPAQGHGHGHHSVTPASMSSDTEGRRRCQLRAHPLSPSLSCPPGRVVGHRAPEWGPKPPT